MRAEPDVVHDVGEADFEQRVIERSRELPVVVDFWAEWCGPCRTLGPVLERAAQARAGKIELAKVDVDANQGLAARFGVQGIPAVKAFRDGRMAAEFTGAQPPAEVDRFFDALVPSQADELVAAGDEGSLRRALALEPAHAGARNGLARLLLRRGENESALQLVEETVGDFLAEGLAARARLAQEPDQELAAAFAALDEGDVARGLEELQEAFDTASDPRRRDLIRRAMIGVFTELGTDSPLVQDHRRRLAAALN